MPLPSPCCCLHTWARTCPRTQSHSPAQVPNWLPVAMAEWISIVKGLGPIRQVRACVQIHNEAAARSEGPLQSPRAPGTVGEPSKLNSSTWHLRAWAS